MTGKTPLVRAKNLERYLGVKSIYLKLEGTNPTGHQFDRIAEVLCKDAVAHHKDIILVDGTWSYLKSFKHFAASKGLTMKVPRFKHETWKKRLFSMDEIIDFRSKKIDQKKQFLQSYATKINAYVTIEGYTNEHIKMMALEHIGIEIISRLTNIDTVSLQFTYGYGINSLYNVFLKQWMKEDVPLPRFIVGTSLTNRALQDDDKKFYEQYIQSNEPILKNAKTALNESVGNVINVDVDQLKEAKRLLRYKENINASTYQVYGLASFINQVKQGNIHDGTHVIVIKDGKSRIEIESLEALNKSQVTEVYKYADTFLAQYSDSIEEMTDAIEQASQDGFILYAKQNNEVQGICVIVNMGFEAFIPKYHLAYIGTHPQTKGRGIATELIKRAIDQTNGSLSLHVDLDNKNAKKLYEKMGFKHSYNRMIYYENE